MATHDHSNASGKALTHESVNASESWLNRTTTRASHGTGSDKFA
jgi:hypothetical protein